MACFKQITLHLSTLSAQDRGNTFERYCKWFLENDPGYKPWVKYVWLWNDWPGNWGRDKGIDLIAETHEGEIWAIQAKAYDENYYITKTDIDTFLSESSRKEIQFRLLIATTNKIGPNAQGVIRPQEKQVGLCLLDVLEESVLDWSSVFADSGKQVKNVPKIPREHQEEAINATIQGFEKSSRGQMYMACGTGKTLVGLWIARRLQCQNTLVLVPSISLVAQLYSEWSENCDDFVFDPIFICSDETVKKRNDDTRYVDPSELGFPVTTDVNELIRQYSLNARAKVIFSTYHSSPIIAQACALDTNLIFDLVIADEAHRCAGPANSAFATVVDKNAIKARRTLFMTATPKIFSNHVKEKAQEATYEIVSMDDPEKFGPVFYKLPFSDAIKDGLLSDYQVIISVMDNKIYQQYAERGRFVAIGNHETDARTVASQLMLAKAIKQHNLTRIISFHNSRKNARTFIDSFHEVFPLLNDIEQPAVHFKDRISGDMQQSERSKILKRFKEPAHNSAALLANVKCLSEGVDVPTLDGIAFIDPKGSEIEIVQAVGRAIRKAPDKKIGTILIPVFVDGEMDQAIALEQSSFRAVWKVVKALRAHDDVLAEELDTIRLELGKRTYKSPPKLSKITIDLPVGIGVEFGESLKIKLVENIVEQCSSEWNYQFGLLKEFRKIYPDRWPRNREEFPEKNLLGDWCQRQRLAYSEKKGSLKYRQMKALSDIGFIWNTRENDWCIQFNFLINFRQQYPNRWPKDKEEFPQGNRLGTWFGKQRKTIDSLENWQLQRWNDVQCTTSSYRKEQWLKQFNDLKEFRKKYPMKWPVAGEEFPAGNSLGNWVSRLREVYNGKKGLLEKWQIEALNGEGFSWNPRETTWMMQFEYLQKFRLAYPDRWPGRSETFPDENKLGMWYHKQRYKNNLPFEHQVKLKKIEVPWIG